MADAITGNTQLVATKQDVISAIVQKELAFQAKMVPYVTDVSAFAVKGSKQISFPKLTGFTVIDRVSGAAGDASVLTASVDSMLLDQNAYCAWIIDSMDEAQTTIAAQIEFARRAAAAHGRYVDTQILARAETVGVATTTAAALITRDVVLEMRQSIVKATGDLAQCVFVVSPEQETALLKIDEFTRNDVYGQPIIPNGVIGRLYGVPVVIHQGLAAAQYYLWEKSGLAIGFQKGAAMSEQGANEFGTSAKRVAMDQLFGTMGLQLGMAGAGVGLSPLVIKDNN